MPPAPQPDLFDACPAPDDRDVEWFIGYLAHRDWTFAEDVLVSVGKPVTENTKRWVRGLAERSGGRISSGQAGYLLTRNLTLEQFHHARNTLAHQAQKLQQRVLAMDKVFYTRAPVAVSAGILELENDPSSPTAADGNGGAERKR